MRKFVFVAVIVAIPVLLLVTATRQPTPAASVGSEATLAQSQDSASLASGLKLPTRDSAAGADTAGSSIKPPPAAASAAAPPPPTSASAGSPPVSGTASTSAGTSASLRSSMSGVYTDAQAASGEVLYNMLCQSCHAPLNNHLGPVFLASWGGASAADMMDYLVAEMPKNDPGSLTPTEYAAVIAYLFRVNGMPAGRSELASDVNALKQIRIDTTGSRE